MPSTCDDCEHAKADHLQTPGPFQWACGFPGCACKGYLNADPNTVKLNVDLNATIKNQGRQS